MFTYILGILSFMSSVWDSKFPELFVQRCCINSITSSYLFNVNNSSFHDVVRGNEKDFLTFVFNEDVPTFPIKLHIQTAVILEEQLTVNFYFTESAGHRIRIIIWVWIMSPVVVVDDKSAVVGTSYNDRIRYCSSGIECVPKTQFSVLLVGCVGQVNRESHEIFSETITCI